eukprot:CAMPEP_0201218024 /NCGR_PEP_ID=MMETSP0851-20130426/190363_1 /ASSEMBLY_ACC=CAM_ASM_000631 /TAXON_ID=183588 /ORGANISM="Pseudo-nitzschia fraudulenta, Strain WWA7" /LENGTH=474 /DNA_ID=CAMNT_0047507699 /DNA_START=589 /DNA_END=2013 /DNA_ORIENTATION=-
MTPLPNSDEHIAIIEPIGEKKREIILGTIPQSKVKTVTPPMCIVSENMNTESLDSNKYHAKNPNLALAVTGFAKSNTSSSKNKNNNADVTNTSNTTNRRSTKEMTRVVSLDPPASATISANSTSKEASFDRTTTHAGNLEPNRKRKLASGLEEESKRTFALGEEEPTIDSNHNSTPVSSRRDSVPSHLRNQKMEATDCLLFAAILLDRAVEKEWSENSTHIPTLQSWCGSSTHIPSQPPPQLQKKQQQHQQLLTQPTIYNPTTKPTPYVPPPSEHNGPGVRPEQRPSKPLKSKPWKKMVCEKEKSKKPLKKMVCANLRRETSREFEPISKQPKREEFTDTTPEDDRDCDDNIHNPKDADVLCGRGGKVNKHPGNIVYRKVVEYNKSYYQSVHKKHRILVSQSIVKAILNYGGRFMGHKGHEWTPIGFKRAVQKTSQALRERSNTSDVIQKLDSSDGMERLDGEMIERVHRDFLV